MDPNEILHAAREAYERGELETAAHYYSELDEFLDGGGRLPDRWAVTR